MRLILDAPHREEKELIDRAIAGDKSAFGQLFDCNFVQIFGYLRVRCGNIQDAEDIAENVFINAWESLPKFRSRDGTYYFRAWLFRIARNLVIDHYRKGNREESFEEVPEPQTGFSTVEDRLIANGDKKAMINAIGKLDDRLQDVLIARFVSGLSHDETAKMLGISPGNVRVIQFRALNKLRELLRKDGTE